MAQAQLVSIVSKVVPSFDLRQSIDVQEKQSALGISWSTSLHRRSSVRLSGVCRSIESKAATQKHPHVIRASASSAPVSEAESNHTDFKRTDPDLSDKSTAGPGVEFKLSDFELCSHVSVGLAGRVDEVLFEGVVRNPESPLKGMRVVLRQLGSRRAQRWGQRALQVLARLLPREDFNLSYATRVHGYIRASGSSDQSSTLTLVHGYHGSYSLHQWLHSEDWLSELETRLSLDEEAARRIGDDNTGGPAVSRQLRLVRILMRDLLIGVNYLHSRGYAHTGLRLQILQVSEADRHVKVGLLGDAAAFPGIKSDMSTNPGTNSSRTNETRQLMIAYDIRCVGFIMAKMVLRELMDPSMFALFKSFLSQGHDPAGLREFFLGMVNKGSPSDNAGIQLLDRDGGAGWNLLACMLAIKPIDRISCKEALRHPFLCGPMWRVEPSIEMTRWGIGSTTVRIVEEYIYGLQQRNRLEKLVDTLERMNPTSGSEEWVKLIGGRWRLLYHTGRQIGLTTRKASPAIMIGSVTLTFGRPSPLDTHAASILSMRAEIGFTAMSPNKWPHEKSGMKGMLTILSPIVSLTDGERLYIADEKSGSNQSPDKGSESLPVAGSGKHKKKQKSLRHVLPNQPGPASLPVVRLASTAELEIELDLGQTDSDASFPQRALHEVRSQIPREMFDLTGLVCATYIDSRLMVLRGITGSACLFTRSPMINQSEPLN